MKNLFFYNFTIGEVGITEENGAISNIFFSGNKSLLGFKKSETPLIHKAASQLFEYFNGERSKFDLPLFLNGTDFQMSVWRALQAIPAGETRSYKDIAAMVGNCRACRAVGMANNRNPIAIVIPCHRVIGQNGSPVGYAGGLAVKKYLLELEKSYAQNVIN